MSSNLMPYNFTITDQSPLFQYLPFRDGVISNGWNVTYPRQLVPGLLFGDGPSSHSTTFAGASVRLDWIGTAVYLYGEGSQGGYTISLDGATPTSGSSNAPGLLFSQSDITYGPHYVVLTVGQSVTISQAIITVGMGEVGAVVQNHIIETTIVPLTTDGFVLSPGQWQSQMYFTSDTQHTTPVPRIGTNISGASLSFPLTSASAFYIAGSVNANHGLFDVTITPPLSAVVQEYNGLSSWIGLNTTLYLATGLNRSQTYQVVLKNSGPAGLWLDTSDIVVYDTPPSPQSSTSPSQPASQPSASGHSSSDSKHVGIGVIAGIAAGGSVVLLTFVALLFYLRRHRQRQQDIGQPASFTVGHRPLSAGGVSSISYMSPSTRANHSPTVRSGHSSAPIWVADQYGQREETWSPYGEPVSPTPSRSPANTHSERTRVSGPSVDYSEHRGQMPLHGSGPFRQSTSTEWRLTSVSDRSSVPHVPIDRNRVASPPVDGNLSLDVPPAYSL